MKNRIMFGVYLIYLMRKLRNPFVAETLVLASLTTAMFYIVSVPSVLKNMLASGNLYQYFIAAFAGADLFVQLSVVLAAIIAFFFVRNLLQFMPYPSGLLSRP